jgi:Family of unknown function (DUF5681)
MPRQLFKPGTSGNPGGRPKFEKQIREWFAKQRVPALDANGEEQKDDDGNTIFVDGQEAVLRRLLEIICKGDDKHSIVAIREYLDRAYGKAKQKIDVGGDLNVGHRHDMRALTDEQLQVLAELDIGGDSGDGPVH